MKALYAQHLITLITTCGIKVFTRFLRLREGKRARIKII